MAEPSGQMSRQQLVQVAEQLQEQLQQLEQQRQQLQDYLDELDQTKEAIQTVKRADQDEKVLLPLGSGAYVHARLDDPDAVLAPIGRDVLAEEPPKKAIDRLENRESEAKQAQQEVDQNIDQLQQQLQDLAGSLQGQGQPQPGAGQDPGGPGQAG